MSKTHIEWLRSADGKPGYTINPVKGLCPMACSYCYARRMYKRFKWNTEIRYDSEAFKGLPEKPSRIFVGSTMELFGDWVEHDWMHMIFTKTLARPQHTFIFLTKLPENLIEWSPFPDNCWIGASVTDRKSCLNALNEMCGIQATKIFLSIEPLLSPISGNIPLHDEFSSQQLDWLIIGQQTPVSTNTEPKLEWIRDIVEAADLALVPVFLKNNLLELVNYESKDTEFAFKKEGCYRQEFP